MNDTEKPASGTMPEEERPATEAANTEREAAERQAEELAAAKKNMRYGLLWCVGGLAVTFGTYFLADEGGRYLVAHGAIVWGAIQAGKGLYDALRINCRRGDFAAVRRMVVAAVVLAALIGYLAVLGSRRMDSGAEEGLRYVDAEQLFECPALGLRMRIPAGYTPVEDTAATASETDSTYANHTMYVLDADEWEIDVEAVERSISEEVETIADISEYCLSRDSAYYDGGIIKATRPLAVGGLDMLGSEGRRRDWPGFVFSTYDLKQGQALITVSIIYPAKEYGRAATQKRIGEILAGIELTPLQAGEE